MSEAVSAGRRILVELDRETPPGIRPVIGPVSGTALAPIPSFHLPISSIILQTIWTMRALPAVDLLCDRA